MWRLHGAGRRQAGTFVRGAGVDGRKGSYHHHRRPRHHGPAPSAPAGLHRGAGVPVWLLRQRHGHVGQGVARSHATAERPPDQRGAEWSFVPVRLAQSHRSRRAPRGEGDAAMSARSARSVSRRDFLQATGGLVIGFALAPRLALGQDRPAPLPGSLNANRMLDAWLRVDPNGTVTIFTGKIELGQGIGTALSQIAADELDVDLERIEVVSGDTARTPNEGQTAGSLSIEQSGTALRFACAEARDVLVSAAAAKLGVPAADLKVSDGAVSAPNRTSVTYWDLARDTDLKREATAKVKPKPPAEHRWVGKSIARRDIPKKFTGGAAYVQDVRLPNMVFGRVVRPPSPGAQLLSVDEAAIRRLPGVVAVVRDGSFLAVAAEREELAIRAREALARSARWGETESLPPAGDALYRHLVRSTVPGETVVEKTAPVAAAPVKTMDAQLSRSYPCYGSIR